MWGGRVTGGDGWHFRRGFTPVWVWSAWDDRPKGGRTGSSIGWNGYEPFGLLPSEPRPTFQFLPNFNLAPTLKFKNTAFPRSKSTQTLYDARHENFKQLYLLTELQIPTGYHVINFGSNSNLNIPWILKGFKPCEKSSKFTKILSWLLIHKSEFSCAHLYAINWSLYTSAHMTSFGNKEKSLNLKLKRNQTWITFKPWNYAQTCPQLSIDGGDLELRSIILPRGWCLKY
jgi:hypothetical protein